MSDTDLQPTETFTADPNCKHADLMVERNNGVRWVTCGDCGDTFVNITDASEAGADAVTVEGGLVQLRNNTGIRADVVPLGVERSCRVCGCTEDNACPGGCSWVVDVEGDLCSSCAEEVPRGA